MLNTSESTVFVPVVTYESPRFPHEDEITLFKALAQNLAEREAQETVRSYKDLQKAAEGFQPTDFNPIKLSHDIFVDDSTEQNPLFNVFDESAYTPLGSRLDAYNYGHPYESPEQLLASTLTVARFFPDEFVKRFASFGSDGKNAIRDVVQSVKNVLVKTRQGHQGFSTLIPDQRIFNL